jgi:hypothetical protein
MLKIQSKTYGNFNFKFLQRLNMNFKIYNNQQGKSDTGEKSHEKYKKIT